MKKNLKQPHPHSTNRAALFIVSILLIFSLVSCGGGISGKYSSELMGMTFEFKTGNKVIYTYPEYDFGASGISSTEKSVEGTYEINDGVITFSFDDAECDMNGDSSFEKGKDYIKIDGVTFIK